MGTQGTADAGERGGLAKLALPTAVAAAGAGLAWILTSNPKRLQQAVSDLPAEARELLTELKERMESVRDAAPALGSDPDGGRSAPSRSVRFEELAARRRDRSERRTRRRHAIKG